MKPKLLLFAVATGLAIAASASTFAAGTSSPPDAKSAATLPAATNACANAAITTVQVEPSAIAIAGAKTDIKTIADAKVLGDPDWKTISAMRGVLDGGVANLKTALVDSSAQGGGGSGYGKVMPPAAGTGSHTSAPAIGYSPVDLASLMQTDRSAVAIITA